VDDVQDLQQRMQNGFKNCALLGYYPASSGNFLPTFRDNLSAPSSVFKDPEGNHGSESLCSGNFFIFIYFCVYFSVVLPSVDFAVRSSSAPKRRGITGLAE